MQICQIDLMFSTSKKLHLIELYIIYTQRCNNVDNESTRIVETAAKLIKMQLKATKYEMESYPSTQTIADTKSNQDWLPNLLQTFMEAMIADEVKQASIGQAIVYAAIHGHRFHLFCLEQLLSLITFLVLNGP